ncbi:MAG TPA: carotenoid oxygenase family protein [Ramlibacter sp.]|jgi:carotenoid cleavage dioxygenase
MTDFSAHSDRDGYFAPTRFEADVYDCEVKGEIPPGIDGAFYRLHPNWLYPPAAGDTNIAADGYISMLRIRGGRADYKGRYVRTQRFEAQRKAGRNLYGGYRNPFTDDPSVRDPERPHLRSTANTTPVVFGGVLYATKEDGLPHVMDPNTLATIGPTDFGGQWESQTFTAHPKFDPNSRELVTLGYEASGPASRDVLLASIGEDASVRNPIRFNVPYTTMLHDMAITTEHVVVPSGGTVTSLERLKAGKLHWAWDSALPFYFAVIPRKGKAADIRWFKGPQRSVVHVANAYTQGTRVILDAPVADSNMWPDFEDVQGTKFFQPPYTLRRFTFDLASDGSGFTEEVLLQQPITSFTVVDGRFTGRQHRFIFSPFFDAARPNSGSHPQQRYAANSIGRFDTRTAELAVFQGGASEMLQEPSFIPRAPDSDEGDGWLIFTAHDPARMRACIVLADAVTLREVARVILPFRNPTQFHGTWADRDELPMN